ncbi:ferredoxin reductase family protein [Pontivivens insulae]|nr:ferric reductase-like transmembrane domain-containing protein [Pontivivens insulae]
MFGFADLADHSALVSQYLGMLALVLMAWTQILAARVPGMERLFGGLDRIYVLHKWSGITALLALVMHDLIDAEVAGARAGALADLGEGLGEFSYYGLLALTALSVAMVVPYHLWKWTHKAMGAMFALGALHFALVAKPFAMTDPEGAFTGLLCVAGVLAYFWTLIPDRLRRRQSYEIAQVERTGDAVAVTLSPRGRGLRPEPGQFGIVAFQQGEPHPFSISGIGPDGQVRITMKALGDDTSRLAEQLRVGHTVAVQGPFGRFRRRGTGPQVWIAGGVGITPFVTWAKALPKGTGPVHLIHCVRDASCAAHHEELTALAAEKPELRVHLVESGRTGRLTADGLAAIVGPDLSRSSIAFCGPTGLREALSRDLAARRLHSGRMQYEAFEFRTGIGIEAIAQWIGHRLLQTMRRYRLLPL